MAASIRGQLTPTVRYARRVTTRSRVVAITGASAGIGRATALRLAREGAAIAICARRADRLDAVAADIVAAGGLALPIVADVTRADTGTYLATRAALPLFRRQGSGHIIMVSSIVGKRGVPYMGAYSATKFAQVGLAECLRSELLGSNIHVSVVFPVSTETEFFDVMSRETGTEVTRAMGPRQTVDTVADAIARAIHRPVPEIYPYATSRALVILNALAPGFTDRVVKRFGRKPVR
jgi:short-subunit dehydrogenase